MNSSEPRYDPFEDPVLLAQAAVIYRRALARRSERPAREAAEAQEQQQEREHRDP